MNEHVLTLLPRQCGFFAEANGHLTKLYRYINQSRYRMEDDLILDTSGIFTRYRNDQYDDVYAACFDIHTSKLGGKDMEDIKMKPSLDDVPGWHATYGQHQLVHFHFLLP